MRQALVNGRIAARDRMIDHHAVLMEEGWIIDIVRDDDPSLAQAQCRDLDGALLLPGFIDTQVNGGGGVLFNDAPTLETLRRMGAAHRQFGTTGFLPTLISDDLSVMEQAIGAVAQRCGSACRAFSVFISKVRFSVPRAKACTMRRNSARSTHGPSSF